MATKSPLTDNGKLKSVPTTSPLTIREISMTIASSESPMIRRFRYDKWLKLYGSYIPDGDEVEVVSFMPKRRVIVLWNGRKAATFLWCLRKILPEDA